tara:strand:+ start:3185 stop:3421 length:237 start_codon:yes stop_codon:yes gene_type:complete
MKNSIFIIGIAISSIYLIGKFIEMRFILKENKPLKVLFRDTLLVYVSVIVGSFVIDQIADGSMTGGGTPQVFTNDPAF